MKILITDDDLTMREILKEFFKNRGDVVIECLDIKTLVNEGPNCDLVIADYDTFISFETVLKLDKPTILATGSTTVCYPYTLSKPYTFSDLKCMISIVLNAYGELAA